MGKSPYNIRKFNPADDEDIETAREMHNECFGDSAPWVTNPEDGFWWFVWHKDHEEPVGFCALRPSHQWPNWGYLWRVGVIPGHRGHKLQYRMVQVRERLARKLGWHGIVTDTTEGDHSANNLIRAGFKIYTPTPKWAFEHSIYWRKEYRK